jgi:hypothetical protein
MLLLYKSLAVEPKMVPKPYITANLLEFMLAFTKYFSPLHEKEILWHLRLSMYSLIEKKVIISIKPLYESEFALGDTKQILSDLFPKFINLDQGVPTLDELTVEEVAEIIESESTLDLQFLCCTDSNVDKQMLEHVLYIFLVSPSNDERLVIQDALLQHLTASSNPYESMAQMVDCFMPLLVEESLLTIFQNFLDAKETAEFSSQLYQLVFGKVISFSAHPVVKNLFQENIMSVLRKFIDNDSLEFYQHLPWICQNYQPCLVGKIDFLEMVFSLIDPITVNKVNTLGFYFRNPVKKWRIQTIWERAG